MNIKLLAIIFFVLLATGRSDDTDNGKDDDNDDDADDDDDDDDDDDEDDEREDWFFLMRQCCKEHNFPLERVHQKNNRMGDSFCQNDISRKWSTCWLQKIGAMKDYNFDEKFVAMRIQENQKPKLKICTKEISKKEKKWIACTILECFKREKIEHKNEITTKN